jgi:hypothetical protein
VNSLVTALVEHGCKAGWQLCVYEEPHAAPGRVDPLAACGQRAELKCSKQVVALQIRVVRQDFLNVMPEASSSRSVCTG